LAEGKFEKNILKITSRGGIVCIEETGIEGWFKRWFRNGIHSVLSGVMPEGTLTSSIM